MGEQGLSVSGEITPKSPGELERKKNCVCRQEVSENETRDGATVCELGVHFQVEKTENTGS